MARKQERYVTVPPLLGRAFEAETKIRKEKWKKKSSGRRKRAGFVWVILVEVGDELGSVIELIGREPRSFFVGTVVTEPFDEIEKLAATASVQFGV